MGKEKGNKVSKIELGLIIGLMLVIIFGENLNYLISKIKENVSNSNKDDSKDDSNDDSKDNSNNSNYFVW